MHVPSFIQTKRDGKPHSENDIRAFIGGVVSGDVPDYQTAAWLMAVVFQGLNNEETAVLASAMTDSGDRLDLSGLPHTVDKHSTGGVGDKTTLVLAPLLAELGGTVAKMSGRGLGHTGGTTDKLESIAGFNVTLDEQAFLRQAAEVGVVVAGASKRLAPADGKLYALRDATATVKSLPLIASSIMSKKLAGGANALVLDVKVGQGAFMKTVPEAVQLGRLMKTIGEREGRKVAIVLTDMDQPLGRAVGNANEVLEAIQVLQGFGPQDVRDVVVRLACEVLAQSGLSAAERDVRAVLDDGRAYTRFERWVHAQGGRLDDPASLAVSPDTWTLTAPRDGAVSNIDALAVGEAVRRLGGGRARKEDAVDHGVGVELHAKVGERVAQGEPLVTLRHRSGRGLEEAQRLLESAFVLDDQAAGRPVLLEVS
jgi:pyrimidine-nucleoside phosphorylase/thymidine phosphorylase